MPSQSLPAIAHEYTRAQRVEVSAALAAANRLWSRMTDDFDASYARVEPELLAVSDLAQRRVATGAAEYAPEVLRQTDPQALRRPADYSLDVDALVGTTGAGFGTDAALYGSVIRSKSAIKAGASVPQALDSGRTFLAAKFGTILSDTGRTAEKVTANGRGVTMYIRMLGANPCGRCVILAGRETRTKDAFLRHPSCSCRNIPAAESVAGDMTVDPWSYLDSLDDRQLARTLGSQANAQAWRDGADANQIINAYRRKGAVRPAQVYGRNIKYTTAGTSRRGWAGRAMDRAGLDKHTPRLMPESIYSLATDRADAQRLLRMYGWII